MYYFQGPFVIWRVFCTVFNIVFAIILGIMCLSLSVWMYVAVCILGKFPVKHGASIPALN